MAGPANVSLKLAARAENVALVREVLGGLGEAIDLGPVLDDVRAATSEACNNVVVHAYDGADGPLEVELRLSSSELEVLVRDRGTGSWRRPEPDDEALPHGIGLTVIDALTLRTELHAQAGRGTDVEMWFEVPDPGFGEAAGIAAPRDPGRDEVTIAIAPAKLCAPILGRLVAALAARAGFSIDRLSDAQLLSDALAARLDAAFGLSAAIETLEGRAIQILIEGLDAGGAAEMLAGAAPPELGGVIERLADEVEVAGAGAQGETLRLLVRDVRGTPAG
jgi:serine/threonine-protein kinase RsbW